MAYNNVKVKARQTVTQSSTQTDKLGTVSEVPMGEWNSTTNYVKLNTVRYKGATYIAKKNNNEVEPTVTTGWQQIWQVVAYDGKGIASTQITYQAGISGSIPPTGDWESEVPEIAQGQYLWTRTIVSYTDNTKTISYSVSLQGLNFTQQDRDDIDEIEAIIPSTATPTNQLADKAFVNSSINSLAAFYIEPTATGSEAFATKTALTTATTFYSGGQPRIPTQNDYAIVLSDESQPQNADGSYPTTRYSWQGGTYPAGKWSFQYVVNNTPLTQAQVDAINSGITASKIASMDAATAAKYTKPSGGIPESDLSFAVQSKLNASSSAPQKNLYNLGTYDTVSSNGDGTVTITRKTGYLVFDGSENWEDWQTKYGKSALTHINPILVVYSGSNSATTITAVTNGFSITNEDWCWGAQRSKDVAFSAFDNQVTRVTISITGVDNGMPAKKNFYENPCYIQYELTTPYAETVIENQPIHTINQDGEQRLREEWEKGLNISPVKEVPQDSRVLLVDHLPTGTYTIAVNDSMPVSGARYQLFTTQTGGTPLFTDTVVTAHTFTITVASPIYIYVNSIGGTTSIMLNKGAHAYPYQSYKGDIVRTGGAKMVGSLEFPVKMSSEPFEISGLIQAPVITGRAAGSIRERVKYHGIEMGMDYQDYFNFNEWGGAFNFYETSVLSEDEEAGQDGNLIFRITPYGLSYNHRRGLNYTQGLRLNSREDDWSALFIGNQLDTVEGRYDKAVIVARPPSVDYCVITGQGNENNDGKRVRINRNGELYERGSRVYSNNNRPEIVTRASNDISPQGLDPGLHRMGFLSYSTTSSTGIQIKLPSAGSYYWIVHVSDRKSVV